MRDKRRLDVRAIREPERERRREKERRRESLTIRDWRVFCQRRAKAEKIEFKGRKNSTYYNFLG